MTPMKGISSERLTAGNWLQQLEAGEVILLSTIDGITVCVDAAGASQCGCAGDLSPPPFRTSPPTPLPAVALTFIN